jgi:hypothetical protein
VHWINAFRVFAGKPSRKKWLLEKATRHGKARIDADWLDDRSCDMGNKHKACVDED